MLTWIFRKKKTDTQLHRAENSNIGCSLKRTSASMPPTLRSTKNVFYEQYFEFRLHPHPPHWFPPPVQAGNLVDLQVVSHRVGQFSLGEFSFWSLESALIRPNSQQPIPWELWSDFEAFWFSRARFSTLTGENKLFHWFSLKPMYHAGLSGPDERDEKYTSRPTTKDLCTRKTLLKRFWITGKCSTTPVLSNMKQSWWRSWFFGSVLVVRLIFLRKIHVSIDPQKIVFTKYRNTAFQSSKNHQNRFTELGERSV